MKSKTDWLPRFKAEAAGHLTASTPLLAQLDADELSDEEKAGLLRQLFIKAHSIKGTASMLGLYQITDCAAELEALWGNAWLEPFGYNPHSQVVARDHVARLNDMIEKIEVQ